MHKKTAVIVLNLALAVILVSSMLAFPIPVSAEENLRIEYWPGGEPDFSYLGTWQIGQTFTAPQDMAFSAVELFLLRLGESSPLHVTVTLKAVDINSALPVGPALASATFNCENISDNEFTAQKFYFNQPFTTVFAGEKYAILVAADNPNDLIGIASVNPGAYAGGCTVGSNNGLIWNLYSTTDVWFRIYEEILPDPVLLWSFTSDDSITDVEVGELTGDASDDVAAIDMPPTIDTLSVISGEGQLYWEKTVSGYAVSIGDINNDGENEVIVAGGPEHNPPPQMENESDSLIQAILAFRRDATGSTPPIWVYPVTREITCMTLGDVDGDGVNDVIACDINGGVYAVNGSGQALPGFPKAQVDTQFERFMDVAVGPLDQTGGCDIAAIGSGPVATLYTFKSNGDPLWPSAIPVNGRTVAMGDVNGDGLNEVVAGTEDGHVYVYRGIDGYQLAGFTTTNGAPVEDVELGELDDNTDNGLEITCISGLGPVTLYALTKDDNGNLVTMWTYGMSWDCQYYGESIAIGDVDRDYKNEVVACSSLMYHGVYAFDGLDGNNDGIGDLVWKPYMISGNWDLKLTDLELGDLDGDGDQEGGFGTSYYLSPPDFSGSQVIAIKAVESSAQSDTGTGEVYFDSDPSSLENLVPVSEDSLPAAGKPNYDYPHGFFSFSISGLDSGETATITVTLPDNAPIGTKWVKYHNNQWYTLDIGDDEGDNGITFQATDGDISSDSDETVNGRIVDPGAPGYPNQQNPVGIGGEVSGTNKAGLTVVLAAVLSAVLAALLAALAGFISLVVYRRIRS